MLDKIEEGKWLAFEMIVVLRNGRSSFRKMLAVFQQIAEVQNAERNQCPIQKANKKMLIMKG
jgi:uncharacterized membrane protein